MKKILMGIAIVGSLVGVGGCKKKGDAADKTGTTTEVKDAAPTAPGTAAAAPAAPAGGGCGTDWANPLKTYCVTVPAGYTPGEATSTANFHAEKIKFTGPDGSFDIYDDMGGAFDTVMAEHDREVKTNSLKESGATPGTGTWWFYTESETPRMVSVVKANNGDPIWCHANDSDADEADGIPAGAMAACKSLRAYPK